MTVRDGLSIVFYAWLWASAFASLAWIAWGWLSNRPRKTVRIDPEVAEWHRRERLDKAIVPFMPRSPMRQDGPKGFKADVQKANYR